MTVDKLTPRSFPARAGAPINFAIVQSHGPTITERAVRGLVQRYMSTAKVDL